MRRLALLAALALLLAGCGGDDSGIVYKDPRGTVDVERGMEFTFEFSVNASVGYDWELGPIVDSRSVELVSVDVHYEDPDRIGDSGVKRFKLRAGDAAGNERLAFDKRYRGDLKERRVIELVIR